MNPDRDDPAGEPGVRSPGAVNRAGNRARTRIRPEGRAEVMAGRPGRRRRMRVLAIAAVLACLAGWHYWPGRQKYAVLVPSPHASPRRVVVAYLRALDAHDTTTAQALSAPGERATTASWLNDTAGITAIKIDSVQHFTTSPPYYVCTDFRYSSHPWTDDSSFPDGEHYWCYDLVRRHGRWLIYDDGLG
jgi:hypothetical protein